MKPTRRTALATLGASLASLPGCTALAAVREGPPASPDGPVPGEADPVAVRQAFAGGSYDYLPATDEVRYPVAADASAGTTGNDSDPEYATVPFDRWAEERSARVGARAVESALAERLRGGADVRVAATDDGRPRIEVRHRAAPPGFDDLVDATPGRVTVTLVVGGREYVGTHRVVVVRVEGK